MEPRETTPSTTSTVDRRPSGAEVDVVRVGNATYYVRRDVEELYNRVSSAMRCADGRKKPATQD